MDTGNERTPQRRDSIEDVPFNRALEKYPAFLSRLDGINSEDREIAYDEIIDAIERAAVDDGTGTGEKVVFDIEGYVDGYEDEELEADTVPLEKLKNAVLSVKDNPTLSYEEVRQLIENIPVRNAVIAVWSLEDKNQIDE